MIGGILGIGSRTKLLDKQIAWALQRTAPWQPNKSWTQFCVWRE